MEFGSLEGGHTYLLEKKGGADVTAIEANKHSFLKSLIIKNTFDLKAKFFLGDFVKYLDEADRFDAVFACGVLYHMSDPVSFLDKISKITDTLYLWTHYYNDNAINICPRRGLLPFKGHNIFMHRNIYGKSAGTDHIHGIDNHSYWLEFDSLFELLNCVGFETIEIHLNNEKAGDLGGAISLLAQKKK